MTEFFRICCIGALGSALLLILAGKERELTAVLTALLLIGVVLHAVSRLGTLLSPIRDLLEAVMPEYVHLFLPLCGIAVGGTAAASLCEAVGQKSIAAALEFLAAMEILILAIVPIRDMLEQIFAFLE